MLKILLCNCSLLLILTSCKTFNIDQPSQTKTVNQITLGAIGSEKDYFFQNGFNASAVPNYKSPIKLSVFIQPFTKKTYKAFAKAKALQPADIIVNYIDSIADKPKYIQLQIADKVGVVKALNGIENKGVKDYLSLHSYAQVLTRVSIAFGQKELENIMNADAVFLMEEGIKTYELQLYKGNKKTETILLNQGVVFEYNASNCCWKESKRHQLDIVDLVNTYSNCPNKTYRSAKRAQKTINYYKL